MATVSAAPRTTTFTTVATTAGPFNITFRLFDTDSLDVYLNGVRTTAFTVSAAFLDGFTDSATLTLSAAVPSGTQVIIDGALTPRRNVNYLADEPRFTAKMNIELARLWSGLSEVKRDSERSIRGFTALDPDSAVTDSFVDDVEAQVAAAVAAASAAAASAADAAMAVTEPSGVIYPTRGLFVTDNTALPGLGLVDGQIVFAAGMEYRRLLASTMISDLPGWVPNGDPHPEHFGATDALGVPYEYIGSGGISTCPQLRTRNRPRIELGMGQSNISLRIPGYSWRPAPNLRAWQYWGTEYTDAEATTHVGVLQAPGATSINFLQSIGDRIASREPETMVYTASISKGGVRIAQYLDGAADPAMMTALRNNVPAWLTAIRNETGWSVDRVDRVHFWQGESDAYNDPVDYEERVLAVITQFNADAWIARTTPIVFYGASPYGLNWAAALNPMLKRVVATNPGRFMFIDQSAYPSAIWDGSVGINFVHMTAYGYYYAGQLAGDAVMSASGGKGSENISYDAAIDGHVFGDQLTRPVLSENFLFQKNRPGGNTSLLVRNTGSGLVGNALVALLTGAARFEAALLRTGETLIRSFSGPISITTQTADAVLLGANGVPGTLTVSADNTVFIGPGGSQPGAVLTVNSTTGGLSLPRMTTAQRDAIVGALDGTVIYNTTTGQFEGMRSGGTWATL